MTTLSLAKPIENIESPDEARVLAVIDHLMPILGNWRAGEDLRNAIDAADQALTECRAGQERAQGELVAARSRQSEIAWNLSTCGKKPVVIAAVGLLLGLLAGLATGIPTGLVIAAIGLAIGGTTASRNVAGLRLAAGQVVSDCEKAVAEAATATEEQNATLTRLKRELAGREVGFPEVRLADVRFGLESAEVVGHTVLLDLSGAHAPTNLTAVDVSALEAGVDQISEKVKALLSVPPLLAPDSVDVGDDPVHQLFGEESELQELVGEFTVNLGRLRDVSLQLPMVPRTSPLVQRLKSGKVGPVADGPAIGILDATIMPSQIQEFVNEVNQSRTRGQRIFSELETVFGNLENACGLYARARTESINTIHHNLLEVLGRAAWCNRRFYCPRTILSPRYIQALLQIDLDRAYLLSFDDLMQRLRSDGEIARRLVDKPELERTLSECYEAVQTFMGEVSFDQEGNPVDRGDRPSHIESQFQEAVTRFRNSLQRVMTGAEYPILNFSAEARLYYDPDSEEWSSQVSPYVYDTADTVEYGGVVKAYSDLMVPLWEHLWTEKADFRKSELFRTNESMIRMSEKESEKLIEVANQFRADMRAVRENVYVIEADLKSKYSEIVSFRDGMDRLGLLSERAKGNLTDEKLRGLMMGDLDSAASDRYEMLLNTMPQAQAENRGRVLDPIDLIREPDALLRQREAQGARLLSA